MTVNIPRTITDDFYRYTMPVIKIKIEGKGNGIRSVITNITEISKALNRPVDHIGKFFEYELGTQSKTDNNGLMIRGKHSADILANVLDKFINIYILCCKCQNPETILYPKLDKVISKCKACGNVFNINHDHKLTTHIIKSETSKTKIVKNNSIKIEETDEEWTLDISTTAVNNRKQVLEVSNSMKIKQTFVDLFADKDIRTDFYLKILRLQPLINNDKDMLLLLKCIENFMLENSDLLLDIVHFVNGFYEEELLEEDILIRWYQNKNTSLEIKNHIKSYVDWLS